MRFTHLHSSSRYDRSPESLNRAAKKYHSVADLVTYTEVSSEAREQAIRDANSDFSVVSGDHSPKNDCAIAVRGSRFAILHKENTLASGKSFVLMGKRSADLYATSVVMEDRQRLFVYVVTVIHLPADVERDLNRHRKTDRTVAWLDAFRRSKQQANKLKREFNADAVIYVADFNINFKHRWARALMKVLAPSYSLTWRRTRTAGGTHGRRIIDGTLLRGQLKVIGSAELYPDDPSSDHRPYIETLVNT